MKQRAKYLEELTPSIKELQETFRSLIRFNLASNLKDENFSIIAIGDQGKSRYDYSITILDGDKTDKIMTINIKGEKEPLISILL